MSDTNQDFYTDKDIDNTPVYQDDLDDFGKTISRRRFISTAALAVGTVALFTPIDKLQGNAAGTGDINNLKSSFKKDLASYIPLSQAGLAGGVATLGESGKIPLSQLPDFEDTTAVQTGSGIPSAAPDSDNPQYVYVDLTDGGVYAWDDLTNTWVSATYTPAINSPVTPTGNITSDNVQDALEELQGDIDILVSTSSTGNHTSVSDNGNGTYTVNNSDGSTVIIDTAASSNTYNNTVSGLTSDNVQDAIDELTDLSNNVDLVDNGDGSYTYTKADGSTVVIADGSTSTLVDNNDGTYTYTDETGTVTTIDTNASSNPYDNSLSGLASTDVQSAIDELGATSHVPASIVTASNPALSINGVTQELELDLDATGSYDNSNSILVSDSVQDAIDELAEYHSIPRLSEEGTLTSLPTALSQPAHKYYFNIDTTSGNVDLTALASSWSVTSDPTYSIPVGTEFSFFNLGGNDLTFTQSGLTVSAQTPADAITLLYTGSGYLIKSAIQGSGKKKSEYITALAAGQTSYTLSGTPNDSSLVEVYVAGGHRLHHTSGFSVAGNVVTLAHTEYQVEMGEIVHLYYFT